jgi:hypothetical protein
LKVHTKFHTRIFNAALFSVNENYSTNTYQVNEKFWYTYTKEYYSAKHIKVMTHAKIRVTLKIIILEKRT